MPVKIGIVEDSSIVRETIRDKLKTSLDIQIVMEASNGEDFLAKMKVTMAEQPDIVLMDVEMPAMDGIQTIAIASTLYPLVKFIVLTVFDNNEKIFEAIKAGANGYLLKNDNAISLTEAVLQVKNYNAVPMSPAIARKTLRLLQTGFAGKKSKQQLSILSTREQDVLQQLVEGLEYKKIAERLFISPATVRTHIAHIYQKLHVNSKSQAIGIAYKNKWI